MDWIPNEEYSTNEIIRDMSYMTLEMQSYLIDLQSNRYEFKSKEFQKLMRQQISYDKIDNKRRFRYLDKSWHQNK